MIRIVSWPAVLIATVAGSFMVQSAAAQEKPVYVVTHVDVTPDHRADCAQLLQQFSADSRKDPGFVRFEVLQQDSRTNHFSLVEVWQTRQAFEAHSAAEHTKRFREKLEPMLGSPYDERLHALLP
jgi:quinol monooxygenase YgiN